MVRFTDEKGLSRSFRINRPEKIIEGRGITGFFKDYQEAYLFIEKVSDGDYKVYGQSRWDKKSINNYDVRMENRVQLEKVVRAMHNPRDGDISFCSQLRQFKITWKNCIT